MNRLYSVVVCWLLVGASVGMAAISSPSDLYYLCESPYSSIALYWTDNSSNETGFQIEQKVDGGGWTSVATVGANAVAHTLTSFDRSLSSEFRVVAFNASESSEPSDAVRVVGTSSVLEVYPEVPGIRSPQTYTNGTIVYSELQDQCPAEPAEGKVCRISTMFSVQVRPASGGDWLDSPTYETRPQIRDQRPQDDPFHTSYTRDDNKTNWGHTPYSYGKYGPRWNSPRSTLHSRHWNNFDAETNVVVRISLLAGAPTSSINLSQTEIMPSPLAITQVNSSTIDVTLPAADAGYSRHYMVAFNRTDWITARGENTVEHPLMIFVNPVDPAPASAPEDTYVEFHGGQLLVMGSGIHLPDDHWRFFGVGENNTVREMYVPGDSYLHGGFIFNNQSHAVHVWGRGIFSDEMFYVYYDENNWTERTPWAGIEATEGNAWGLTSPWDGRVLFKSAQAYPGTLEGLCSLGKRFGACTGWGGHGRMINCKDVAYGGALFQDGNSTSYYLGNFLLNDDDVIYCHQNYLMEHCTSLNLVNGPSFQFGWGVNTENDAQGQIFNHHALESDRQTGSSYGKNHGVFNSRLQAGDLEYHYGGYFENFDCWGQDVIVFNMGVFADKKLTNNVVSLFSDKTFKNLTIHEHSRVDNVLAAKTNPGTGQEAYVRFLHFDNLVIEGNHVEHINDGDFFDYDPGVLLHTITFFSLPDPVADPGSDDAPIGLSIQPVSMANGMVVQADSTLPSSYSPLCANADTNATLFSVEDAGDGYIALRAANGYCVKADPLRYGYLYTEPDLIRGDANTTAITDEAKFRWIDLGEDRFALWSKSMQLYVRAESNCGTEMPLYAASATIGNSEKFSAASLFSQRYQAEDYSDMYGIQSQPTSDVGGGENIGYIHHGDWAEYLIDLPDAGNYLISFRVASPGTGSQIEATVGTNSVAMATVPTTGGWQVWETVSVDASFAAAGEQILRLNFIGGTGFLFNVNWFELVLVTPAPSGYEVWASAWGVDLGAPTDDFDGDGLSNLYEYGLGGNPTNALVTGDLPIFSNNGGLLTYVHPQRSDDPHLRYSLETSTNLVDGIWINAGYIAVGTNVTEETLNYVTNSIVTTNGQNFIRLIIE